MELEIHKCCKIKRHYNYCFIIIDRMNYFIYQSNTYFSTTVHTSNICKLYLFTNAL